MMANELAFTKFNSIDALKEFSVQTYNLNKVDIVHIINEAIRLSQQETAEKCLHLLASLGSYEVGAVASFDTISDIFDIEGADYWDYAERENAKYL